MIAILREVHRPLFPAGRRELALLVERLLVALGLAGRDVAVTLTDDRGIARLNRRFLGLPGPTNVLAFPDEEGFGLGEVALCLDALLRESRLYGQDPAEHLLRLLAHALLHCAGLEHGPEMDHLAEAAVAAVSGEAFQPGLPAT